MAAPPAPAIDVPEGFTLHTENTTHLLLESNQAFLNPVQEFNRDLSVACIRLWSEELDKAKEERWKIAQEKKAKRGKNGPAQKKQKVDTETFFSIMEETSGSVEAATSDNKPPEYRPYKITILEALSATGLRAIRYAKEIPSIKNVIANDLSPTAAEAIRRNVGINGIPVASDSKDPIHGPKITINEGDACVLMYNHREERKRVDVVDLDPYGTAAPFIDAAVQSVNDGGLLCVTCTDLTVLGTTNYPEKCYSNYGGVSVKAEYCHEAALRLVLHTISTSASRYGRYIQPMLSLSIDFYVRLFVRVFTQPTEVKKALTKTSIFYVCSSCQNFFDQSLGKMKEQKHEVSGNVNYLFKIQSGPPIGDKCPECDSVLHLAGPMWSGPIHDTDFVAKVLDHVNEHPDKYGTSTRMKGMLTVAKEELHTHFYFTPSKVASFFHCITPSLDEVASALLHAGHQISRSHACPGSLKTTATRAEVHEVFRCWVKLHPVRMDKISDRSPARALLAKECNFEANFKHHPDSVTPSAQVKLVRYQDNPAFWGPGTKAASGTTSKRKRE